MHPRLIAGLLLTWRYRLVGKKSLSLAPSLHWPEPVVVIDTNANEGPAITSIDMKSIPSLLKSSCIRAALSMWVKRCLAEQYIIESAWEAQWLEYVKSAPTLERQPRA
jgi:hypothetical protein